MDTDRKLTDKTGKKPRTLSYKYSFHLNEEQNIHFNELLCKAGSEHNRSRFIVKRIFAEEFVVVRRDPSKSAVYCPAERLLFSISESWGITVRPSRRYNKYSDGKLLGKCSLQITYHQPTYLKGKPDRECSMSG